MLVHLGETEVAERINNAWLATLESGIHTADIYREGLSRREVGTCAFTDAVIEQPRRARREELDACSATVRAASPMQARGRASAQRPRTLLGVDVFLDWHEARPQRRSVLGRQHGEATIACRSGRLKMITNRGVKVFPDGLPETFCTDHWRCRFLAQDGQKLKYDAVVSLLSHLAEEEFDVIKTENLYSFDGERGYSLGQGE